MSLALEARLNNNRIARLGSWNCGIASILKIVQPGYHDSEHQINLVLLPQFRLAHPIRLYHPTPPQAAISPTDNNLPLLGLFVPHI